MNIKHRIDASIAELTMLRSSLSDKHDEQASEYKAMHRRIAAQRSELARLNDQHKEIAELRRRMQVTDRDLQARARRKAEHITANAGTNIATAWRELALERMRLGETEQELKIAAMLRAVEIGNRPFERSSGA